MSVRGSHTSGGRRAKFWTTQTIHLSVRRGPDAGLAQPGVRPTWRRPAVTQPSPLDRHTTGARPTTVLHVRISRHTARYPDKSAGHFLNVTVTALSRTPPGHLFNRDLGISILTFTI